MKPNKKQIEANLRNKLASQYTQKINLLKEHVSSLISTNIEYQTEIYTLKRENFELKDKIQQYEDWIERLLMPYHIRIMNIRVEQLQEISNEDCLKEGIRKWADADPMYKNTYQGENLYEYAGNWDGFCTPRRAFAALIDKISGKGTWLDNPWVFVYEFELINSKE